jgi:hypothetical protein
VWFEGLGFGLCSFSYDVADKLQLVEVGCATAIRGDNSRRNRHNLTQSGYTLGTGLSRFAAISAVEEGDTKRPTHSL